MAQANKKMDYQKLSGMEKTAIMMISVNKEHAVKLFSMMDDDEIKEVSASMASLGQVDSEIVERVMEEFSEQMSSSGAVMGTYETTEQLLLTALGKDRVDAIMEDIRGPAGRNTWEKLGNVSEEVLAGYLKNEYPQTIALVLSKISPDHAAKVLTELPEDLSMDVIMRMLSMEPVKREVLEDIEKTLRIEFMSNLAKTQRRDSHEMMAEIFNNFDRNTETKFLGDLEDRDQESAERIRALMFTFEDLIKIDGTGVQIVLRNIDKDKLAIALKGASEEVKDMFLNNMSERASKILLEEMEAMGPVRLKDVDEAQMSIVVVAKELAAKGEIVISENKEEDQLIY
jgi:flagellar motor switch protein FliG